MAARRQRSVLGTAFFIILATIVVYALVMAVSVSRAANSFSQANQSFEAAKTSINEGDFVSAYTSARSAMDSLSELSKELSGPQWGIAAALPVVGDDVRTARELAATGGLLVDEAALPILDQLEVSLDEGYIAYAASALLDPDNGQAVLSEYAAELENTLQHSADVVYECERRLNALPDSHIEQLNETAGALRQTVSETAELLRTVEQINSDLEAVGAVTDVSQTM